MPFLPPGGVIHIPVLSDESYLPIPSARVDGFSSKEPPRLPQVWAPVPCESLLAALVPLDLVC